jgi:HK97 family phage prohead protease
MFREKISPGAFKKTIKEADVRALFNHNPNFVLGRNKASTLRLSEDQTGLAYEIDLPDTQVAKDLYTSIERGDVSQSSFAFKIVKETRTEPMKMLEVLPLFDIKEMRLFDVSPVTYPAYGETDVQACAEGDPVGYGVAIKRFAEFCARPIEEVRQLLEEHGEDADREELLVRLWLPYEFRTVVPYQNLPVAKNGDGWDAGAARARVKEWAGGDDWKPAKYRRAFCWYDAAAPNLLGSYKFPIGDVRNDALKVVPEGVYAAAGRLESGDLADSDKSAIRSHLGKYYKRMNEDAPWDEKASDEEPEVRDEEQHADASAEDEREDPPNDEHVEPPVVEEIAADRSSDELTPDDADTSEPPAAEERADTLGEQEDSTDEPTAESLASRARVRKTLSTF